MPKEGPEGLSKNYFEEKNTLDRFVVSEIIPNIGELYDLFEEGSRVTIKDKNGQVVFTTDINHFAELSGAEKANRIFAEASEDESDQDNS